MSKKHTFSRNKKIIVPVTILVLVLVVGMYFMKTTNLLPIGDKPIDTVEPYKEGSGGDPAEVTRYYDGAIAAYKAGDKDKARELARKGLDANSQLTIAQQGEIPEQANKIMLLSNLSDGAGIEDL